MVVAAFAMACNKGDDPAHVKKVCITEPANQTSPTSFIINGAYFIEDPDISSVKVCFYLSINDGSADDLKKNGFPTSEPQTYPVVSHEKYCPFFCEVSGLKEDTKYYYVASVSVGEVEYLGSVETFTTQKNTSVPTNLSADKSANCYIVNTAGDYCFNAVKGNSTTSVGTVTDVAVLWETFGTMDKPSVGDLVCDASFQNGYVVFSYTGKKGNALIAAKNGDKILWSWHIWCCGGDEPKGQTYFNSAGTMMDRNLGATCTTPGDVGANGLLYQWGRKDPFMGSANLGFPIKASSAGSAWPWPTVASYYSIEDAIAHPMTFFKAISEITSDWQTENDNTRWQTTKTIYDPCPPGWKVPSGGTKENGGVWAKAFGYNDLWYSKESNRGHNFGATTKKLGLDSNIWYPLTGRISTAGELINSDDNCWYMSCTMVGRNICALALTEYNVIPALTNNCSPAQGNPVRCIAE